MKKIVLLGSSGSIGENALRVVQALSPTLKVVGLAVNRNYRRVLQQARQFNVKHVAVADKDMAGMCKAAAPAGIKVHQGDAGVEEIAALEDADVVLCALVGMAGLKPVLSAIRNGTDVALATKEVLVAAGKIVTDACAKHHARLLPVDSEHSAIFQCLHARGRSEVSRLFLTASGGPFASRPEINLDKVTVSEVLHHPTWNMGKKVTVDSATLMNKGLEIMEARWMFNMPIDKIEVVIHPESIVHSLVEFVDGSMMAQLSVPDMRFAIQYALTCPDRVNGGLPSLNLSEIAELHFHEPDEDRFPCLRLAREAAAIGGTMPAVLNAANEIAVQKFLDGEIAFSGIWKIVKKVMARHHPVTNPSLDEIIEADSFARVTARKIGLKERRK
jgi:1-deoxy-D-xylulose-5-phosphate reductoisomerase